MTKTVLVTGSNGQLAKCIKELEHNHPSLKFIFTNSEILDITNHQNVDSFFSNTHLDWCINCAAYTAVDKAETGAIEAYNINRSGVSNLAEACRLYGAKFIHVSTDFVFDGNKKAAYIEEDMPNPINVYGLSKLAGEYEIIKRMSQYYIVRTSWLYSEYGNNFFKTMLKLANEKKEINVVYDQIGTPTYAKDLARALIAVILTDNNEFGIYHYSNEGVASWFDFAEKIFDLNRNSIKVNPVSSIEYSTPAKRPQYSVLDKTKIKHTFGLNISHWEQSLKIALTNIK